VNDKIISPTCLNHGSRISVVEDFCRSFQIAVWRYDGVIYFKPVLSSDSLGPYLLIIDCNIKLIEERLPGIRILEPAISGVRSVARFPSAIVRIVTIETLGCCLRVYNDTMGGHRNSQWLLGLIVAAEGCERSKLHQKVEASLQESHFALKIDLR
jgi:hypothetical protein